jgi:Cu(I)/Ag(I) efflux system protein CusF
MIKRWLIPACLVALLGGGSALAITASQDQQAAPATTADKTISGTGTVKSVDPAAGKLVIDHDPIPALKWPAMVMDFRLADKAMAGKVKAGDKVKFTLTPGDKGSYIVTAIEPVR